MDLVLDLVVAGVFAADVECCVAAALTLCTVVVVLLQLAYYIFGLLANKEFSCTCTA